MHKFNLKSIEKLDNPERRLEMPPKEILEKFGIKDSGSLLDIGCGIGYFTIPAAAILKNGKAIGIDIMPEILDIAKAAAKDLKNIEFKKSEEYKFPVADCSIDYVFLCNVIHEVENKAEYLDEINRVIKLDGCLCIVDWEKKEMKMGPPLQERIDKANMKALCEGKGFTFVEEISISQNYYGLKFNTPRTK